MFTGIVEAVGTVVEVVDDGARSQLTIRSAGIGSDLVHGESIAVDGVCLTVAGHSEDAWLADVMRITRTTTTLGEVEAGRTVNLERALRADGRLGGHIMQGHVDGQAELVGRDSQADWDDFTFALPADLVRYVVPKGSIALNGVSLTVAALEGSHATVSLIPTTLADTTLGGLALGDHVNVEVDVMGKYVESMLAARS
ncbi:riboflavin synthase [Demequina activiva]|uniref:Riboflavin synthase n=1 Tax=Demequina activiva TaxID=1582364 RepID=A0A919UGM0_9MICO|nr:riboflavin synthase [Demequina activiva]GIG54594.1 riboflavin synthase subunit alpha [Demequina activiva]